MIFPIQKKNNQTPEVSQEDLIALMTLQYFKISLASSVFPVWDFLVEIFPRKVIIYMGWVLSTLVVSIPIS